MPTVFYDLETSDRYFCGQIINYAFLEVGAEFDIRSEHCGEVRLGRLQLPSPEAILTNRTDVMRLQETAKLSEKEALLGIWEYLANLIRTSEMPLQLIGYNSSKFDLPFLRTSFIRNGLNPYFEGKLVPGDLLHASRKLAASAQGFPRAPAEGKDRERLSFSLENLCRQFGLLQGGQSHESRGDVLLTIELAKIYKQKFGLDIRTYSAYEVPTSARVGDIVVGIGPQYDSKAEQAFEATPYVLHDSNQRSALWVNLANYQRGKGRASIAWFGRGSSSFFLPKAAIAADAELAALAPKAMSEFKEVTLQNFFPRSVCDIELDIYRLDFNALEALRQAIWERDPRRLKSLKSADADAVYDRHRLANYEWGKGKDERVSAMLREYALYRYGAKMHINKSSTALKEAEDLYSADYHETYADLIGRIERYLGTTKGQDLALMEALRTYYQSSDIYRVAGVDLLKIDLKRPQVEVSAQVAEPSLGASCSEQKDAVLRKEAVH